MDHPEPVRPYITACTYFVCVLGVLPGSSTNNNNINSSLFVLGINFATNWHEVLIEHLTVYTHVCIAYTFTYTNIHIYNIYLVR